MKRIFRTLIFVAMMTTTPFVFTSCDGLLDMLNELLEEMENNGDGDDEYNDDNSTGETDDIPTYEEKPQIHNFYVEVEPCNSKLSIRELCPELANYPSDVKFDINCYECDWVQVEWEQWVDEYKWTPFLVISSNDTEDVREMSFSIDLGENNICNHSVLQHPY
ncbi:MAG: hypothetical protein J6V20_04110 [Bacteroidaceae bacterium]|nr:hypothetical protein [Bacteroidaceae bacterium]